MVNVRRGQIWWVDFGARRGSEPAYRRPALIVQSNSFNESRIQTIMVAPLTTNLRLADAPANVAISKRRSRLPHDSVVNVSLTAPVDRAKLVAHLGECPPDIMSKVEQGLRELLSL